MKRIEPGGGRAVFCLLGVGILLAFQTYASGAPAPPPVVAFQQVDVRWTVSADSKKHFVEVVGLKPEMLQRLLVANWKPAQWQRLLSVYTGGQEAADSGLPAMIGSYQVRESLLRFEPEFPLEPGLTYRAVFRPEQLPDEQNSGANSVIAVFHSPSRTSAPTTVVSEVFPSSSVLPENLLKFYVHFSAPMSRGQIYDHIHLKDGAGREIDLPFLEIDEELWDPAMTRLTLFIDPGRIKRGVLPLEDVGPALEEGKSYTLVIAREWRDGAGNPLKETFQKSFTVGAPDREPPDPTRWTLGSPKAGTREPLVVEFREQMDAALALRLIQVTAESGEPVAGKTALEDQERRWSLAPAIPWRQGVYNLVVQTTIEDTAGNNIGKQFDVDLFEAVQPRLTTSTVKLSFKVH